MKFYINILLFLAVTAINSYLFAEDTLIIKENLGPNINSSANDIYPVISPDGQTLFFYRSGHPGNIGGIADGDIWVSHKKENGEWGRAENIGMPLNNTYNNYVCSVSPDGNSVLLSHIYHRDGKMSKGLSVSRRIRSGWGLPEKLNIRRYYNMDKKFGEYFLANDGKTLLMAVERRNSMGKLDIYVSFLRDSNEWSVPKNLGHVINTGDYEFSPFLASDGVTLYFSSLGHRGYGGADIFMSRRLDDSWQNWTKPKNLGPAINTKSLDGNFKIDAAGEYAYFASADNSYGQGDIFRIKLPEDMKPLPVVLVSGKVTDASNGQALYANVFYEELPEGKKAGIASSNPVTGEYKIILPLGKKYGFRAEARGYVSVNNNIDLSKLQEYKEITEDLFLVPVKDGEKLRLNNIFFDHDVDTLKPESYPELNRLIDLLNEHSQVLVVITGYTDSTGTAKYNLNLSRNRAKAVYDYLIKHGIDSERLEYTGKGMAEPISDNNTEQGRSLNRRVELTIKKRFKR